MDTERSQSPATDIRDARTLPASFYRDPRIGERLREGVFAKSWHVLLDMPDPSPGRLAPFTLMEGVLDEPLLMVHEQNGNRHCLSNVCTHRANILAEEPGSCDSLRCSYHGRRFSADGTMLAAPGFEGARDFPSASDHLPNLPIERFAGLNWISLAPERPFSELVAPVRDRMAGLDLDALRHEPSQDRDYQVDAHWALYCDNYLEGFHIPFVHPGLNRALDWKAYRTELFDRAVLQIGEAAPGESAFELPEGHPDSGHRVAAWYWWIFPNTMLNFYPWGLSLNVVIPTGPANCRVLFRSYVSDGKKLGQGAGSDLNRVEMEDEAIVENVQRGLRSRLYEQGRFSPEHERGVHHFHRMLAGVL